MRKIILSCSLVLLSLSGFSKHIFVSPNGDDGNQGTKESPYKTIQKAADIMQAGDICYIREGIYHETVVPKQSGNEKQLIQFKAYNNESVIINGTKVVKSKWKFYKKGVYKTTVDADNIEQLFADTDMMVEARWPNMKMTEIFDRTKWKSTEFGSKHGLIVSNAVAQSGIDFTGAQAYLNVAHQWWTWNRKIKSHKAGSSKLVYDADLVGLCNYVPGSMSEQNLMERFADDYFYLFGILDALDVETEWYFDKDTKELYFFPPNRKKISNLIISYKTINYGFDVKNKNYIVIDGINFFGCTFKFEDCNYCTIKNVNLKFPTYTRTITEYDQNRKESIITKVVGDHNLVNRIALSYANNLGLMVMGNYNCVSNSIIHDVNWSGTLIYPALQLSASPHLGVNWFNTIQYPPTERTPENTDVTSYGNKAINNTLYNCGSSALLYAAAKSLVKMNHIYSGGKACKDVSLIYGCWPFSRESEVCYNWVYDCYTDAFGSRDRHGGIGIRADDQSRRNIIHHNVVWNIGELGIIAKGEDNQVYNNTVLNTPIPIIIPIISEPVKEFAVQWPQLLRQNQFSKVFNNIAADIRCNRKDTLDDGKIVFNNYRNFKEAPIIDIEKNDFRIKPEINLKDKGVIPESFKIKYKGKAPDIGAYEADGDRWIPGAKWEEDDSWMKLLIKNDFGSNLR